MNSIRKKLFLQIGLLIIGLIGILLIANTFFFRSFYIQREKNFLLNNYNAINAIDTSVTSYNDENEIFSEIENRVNVRISITDPAGNTLYNTKVPIKLGKKEPPKLVLLPKIEKVIEREEINDKLVWHIINDDLEHKHLELIGEMDNGNKIKMRIPLMAIENNIELANQFALITGALLFVVGMVVAYVLSEYFTRPIIEMNRTTNELKHLRFNSKCKVKSNDELGQLAESINDMSVELKETIDSLADSNDELKQEVEHRIRIDEKRKQLLSNVSHELKTPIALLQGYAEGLKLNVAKNSQRKEFYTEVIMDEANKMNQLVQTLLNVNQIEFGDIKVHKTEAEINSFVKYVIDKYEPNFKEGNIQIKYDELRNETMVYTDQLKVEQVLTNFITNAIRYVNNDKAIEVRLTDRDTKVGIEIYNSCDEIPETELTKLWDSFYKLDKARTREYGGYGLGLSIVKAIMEALDNKYGVELKEKGIMFWIEVDKVEK